MSSDTSLPAPSQTEPHNAAQRLTAKRENSGEGVLRATLAAIALLFFAMFWPTISGMPATWWDKGGQGFVVAAFCTYLIWRDRKPIFGQPSPIGVAAILTIGLSLLWLVAVVLNVQLVHQAALPLILLSWLLAVFGLNASRVALPIVGAFFLAVPLWGAFIRPLQSMTVSATGVLLSIFQLEAVVTGEYIKIPSGVFWVAEGCAGLNYFQTSLLISVMYSLLFLNHWRSRFVAVALAVALGVISNWIRVFGLVVIGHYTQMQSSLVTDHVTYGWVIFAVTMVVFFALTKRIETLDRARDATAVAPEQTERNSTVKNAFFHPWTAVLPTMAALVGPALFFSLGGRAATGEASDNAPGIVGSSEWRKVSEERFAGNTVPAEKDSSSDTLVVTSATQAERATSDADTATVWKPQYRGADEHRMAVWQRDSVTFQVDRFLYVDQSQGRELINSGNRVAARSRRLGDQVLGPLDREGRMVNATAVRTPKGVRLVWYWYSVAGVTTHSSGNAKFLELMAFVKARVPPSELVSVSTLCGPDDCNAASQHMVQFVAGVQTRQR